MANLTAERQTAKRHSPVEPTGALVKLLQQSGHEQAATMTYFMQLVGSLWPLCEFRLTRGLLDLGEMLTNAFGSRQTVIRVDIYASAPAISCRMQQEYWCVQVFREGTGMDLKTLSAVCFMAQDEPLYCVMLVDFLNRQSLTLA